MVARTGFEVEVPAGIARTPAPDDRTLALLRAMDPGGVYLKQPRGA